MSFDETTVNREPLSREADAAHPREERNVEIFVSYSARTDQEKELASTVIDLLTSAFALPPQGVFAYTVSGLGAKSGARLVDELKDALAQSRVVLAIITPSAAQSSYTQFELAASELEGKCTIPLLPDPSLHDRVPVLFRDVTARSLASLGEICQLLRDLSEQMTSSVEPACIWIEKAERVVAAAHAASGRVSAEEHVAQLTTELNGWKTRSAGLRKVAFATSLVGFLAIVGLAGLWAMHAAVRDRNATLENQLKASDGELAKLQQAVQQVERRSLLLPALKIEGTVMTPRGRPAEHAVVAACAALPTRGGASPARGELCPEDLRLNLQADSNGVFRIDLRSLPMPDGNGPTFATPGSPLEEIWLLAQHADGGRIEQRVKTVIDKSLTLR